MAERLAKDLATQENPEDEEVRESTYFRLESLGYRVGQGLAERCVDTTELARRGRCSWMRSRTDRVVEDLGCFFSCCSQAAKVEYSNWIICVLESTNTSQLHPDSPEIAPASPITST